LMQERGRLLLLALLAADANSRTLRPTRAPTDARTASSPLMAMHLRRSSSAECADVRTCSDADALHSRLLQRAAVDDEFGRSIQSALSTCSQALRLYGPAGVVTSFNGGKDAVAILHLMRAALAQHARESGQAPRLRVIFFEQKEEFVEVDAFVRETVSAFDLDLVSYSGNFADGLKRCIETHGSAAFVLGTRVGDPNAAGQQFFWPSSDWMPPFMRVNPILDWQYASVWRLLREFNLPFCKLYLDGYTSLGKQSNTRPNPALRRSDGTYASAWELRDGALERAGRGASPVPAPTNATRDSGSGGNGGDALAGSSDSGSGTVPDAKARLRVRTAALLIIGDEILCGKARDENIFEAAQQLRRASVSLQRVSIVADHLDKIAQDVSALSEVYDIVITSGGVGPTHDDVTMKAVARALQRQYERSEPMASLIRQKLGEDKASSEAVQKMSWLPRGTALRHVPGQPDSWPILQVSNVFVLPGVPKIFAEKMATITTHFLLGEAQAVVRQVALNVAELQIVTQLNRIVGAYVQVQFGSYPVEQGATRTIITLEAADEGEVEEALKALLDVLPTASIEGVSTEAGLAPRPAVGGRD